MPNDKTSLNGLARGSRSSDQDAAGVEFVKSRPVAIIGAGVMGTKVAWACARAGIPTRLYDVDPQIAVKGRERAISWSAGADRARTAQHLVVTEKLSEALCEAQFAFENVPERLELKKQVLEEVSGLLDAGAYMGSNTSSFNCTPLATASKRPERFFNMNFSDPLTSRLVEYMGSDQTLAQTEAFAIAWAEAIGMTVVRTRKEQLGYSFNRLWRVVKKEALRQIDSGIATADDIDRAWMLSFGTDIGPCGIMDRVGLATVLAIEESYFADSGDEADRPRDVLKRMVAQGQLGESSGKGFYSYPEPAYRDPSFLGGSRVTPRTAP